MEKSNTILSQNERILLALKNFKFDSEEEEEEEKAEKESSSCNSKNSEKKFADNLEEYEAPSMNSSEFDPKPMLQSKYPNGLKNTQKDILKPIVIIYIIV